MLTGYINAMPITDDHFKQIKKGEIPDSSTEPADVEPYIQNHDVKLYLLLIATDPAVRRGGLMNRAVEKLISGLIEKLLYYAVYRQIRVAEIVACAWTPAGLKLCQKLGMIVVGTIASDTQSIG